MHPGDARIGAGECAFRPGLESEVIPQEIEIVAGIADLADRFVIRLRHHDHRHAEQQRDHQPLGAQPGKPRGAGLADQEIHGEAGDQEEKQHAPLVRPAHRQLQPLGEMHRLDVPVPLGDIEHADVVQDQQREGEHPERVDIVAARGGGGMLRRKSHGLLRDLNRRPAS